MTNKSVHNFHARCGSAPSTVRGCGVVSYPCYNVGREGACSQPVGAVPFSGLYQTPDQSTLLVHLCPLWSRTLYSYNMKFIILLIFLLWA